MIKPSTDMAFWNSDLDVLLLNPRMPDRERTVFETAWVRERGRRAGGGELRAGLIALATSGASGVLKLVLLSRPALLASARGVNEHLKATYKDIWFNVLPTFHVGGLSIYARAALSEAQVIDMSTTGWSAEDFCRNATNEKATLTSLVPAHVFDFVKEQMRPPPTLRAVVIGGGALSPSLYSEARRLGWPILPSYGLTECCSQVATASLESLLGDPESVPHLTVLSHLEVLESEDARLAVRGESLLTGYLWVDSTSSRFEDPKRDSWFLTEDRGHLGEGRDLTVFGRGSDFVKVGGESVDMRKLEDQLDALVLSKERSATADTRDLALLAAPDERLGMVIHFVYADPTLVAGEAVNFYPIDAQAGAVPSSILDIVIAFNQAVTPFERIRRLHAVAKIPRSPLGKLLRADALALVGLQGMADA